MLAGIVSIGATSCVNDYLYGEDNSTSTTSSDSADPQGTTGDTSGATTGAAGSGSSGVGGSNSASTDASGTDGGSSSGSTTGAGTGASEGTSAGGPLELCQGPCAADTACLGDVNLCVELTRGAEPVCLRACGRGCPNGYSCTERTSVDGASRMQCQPDGNVCP